jgi:hypothetical protein
MLSSLAVGHPQASSGQVKQPVFAAEIHAGSCPPPAVISATSYDFTVDVMVPEVSAVPSIEFYSVASGTGTVEVMARNI